MIEQIKRDLTGADAASIIRYIDQKFGKRAVFSTSVGFEDQVVTSMIAQAQASISVFTLETRRLFPETYYVWNRTIETYHIDIQAFYPRTEALQQLLTQNGPTRTC